jgi:hypothetical protein
MDLKNLDNRYSTINDSGSYILDLIKNGESSEEEFNPDQLRALEIIREKKSSKPETDWSQMSLAIMESEKFAAEFVKDYDSSPCCTLI